jgi:hypothetical protein
MKLNYVFSTELKHSNIYDDYKDITLFRSLFNIDADAFLVDRTDTISFPFSENNIFPMLTTTTTPLSWQECADNRVKELVKTGEKLYVMWSGGIDSTLMLISFMKHAPNDQIVVVLNQDSVKEYPRFYKTNILPSYQILATEELMLLVGQSNLFNGLLISAEHADQLVGSPISDLIVKKLGRTMLGLPYNDENFEKFLLSAGVPIYHIDILINIYNMTIEKSPRPIKTMWDLCWWHGFNFKWQTIAMKLAVRMADPTKLITFYSSNDFQNTSIQQTGNVLNLKSEFKEIILDYTLDGNYWKTKEKFASSTLYYSLSSPAGLTEKWDRIPVRDLNLIDYYNADNTLRRLINA